MGTQVVYRVKKAGAAGGYAIVTEDSKKKLSREELLQGRRPRKRRTATAIEARMLGHGVAHGGTV